MRWRWFDLAWPWIGLGGAAILLTLLFGTQKLRAGVVLSLVLLGSMQARIQGLIGNTTLVLIQIVNPVWFFLLP